MNNIKSIEDARGQKETAPDLFDVEVKTDLGNKLIDGVNVMRKLGVAEGRIKDAIVSWLSS